MSDPISSPAGSEPAPDKPVENITSKPTAPPPATATTAAPPKPAVPAKPPAKAPAKPGRRGFIAGLFSWFSLGWITFAGSMGVMTLGSVRFLFLNVLAEPPSKIKVGYPDTFEDGKVVERFKDQNTWLVRFDGKIYALSTTCTHLGCTPNWLEREAKFKCPCHGSGFYISGINFEGPAPRPLERWGISVGEDGQIVVDKSKKFQQERGEWTNPESFIKV
jgi:cytochrome b6-f complex iron-sulfur subunit